MADEIKTTSEREAIEIAKLAHILKTDTTTAAILYYGLKLLAALMR